MSPIGEAEVLVFDGPRRFLCDRFYGGGGGGGVVLQKAETEWDFDLPDCLQDGHGLVVFRLFWDLANVLE